LETQKTDQKSLHRGQKRGFHGKKTSTKMLAERKGLEEVSKKRMFLPNLLKANTKNTREKRGYIGGNPLPAGEKPNKGGAPF